MERSIGEEIENRRWSIAAVIPTYNRATLVERALDSALEQRRPPDEIIVVDDGSTDGTAAVVAAYGDQVTLITQPRLGQSRVRNLCVERSRSDYVAFLDSDDLWDASHLMRMERAIEATDGQGVLYFSDALSGDPRYAGLTFWGLTGFESEAPHELRANADWLFASRHPIINFSVCLMRRDAYLAVGGAESRLTRRVDTHLFFKLGLSGPVCAVAGPAAILMTDDPASVTSVHPEGGETYLDCTVWLYDDLLRRTGLTRTQRRVLRRRLADGYWDLARLRGIRAPRETLASLALAARHDPMMLTKRLGKGIRRVATTRRVPSVSVE